MPRGRREPTLASSASSAALSAASAALASSAAFFAASSAGIAASAGAGVVTAAAAARTAPCSIHCLISAISASGSGIGALGHPLLVVGGEDEALVELAFVGLAGDEQMILLLEGAVIWSAESSRNFAAAFSAPWQPAHLAVRIGWICVAKSILSSRLGERRSSAARNPT